MSTPSNWSPSSWQRHVELIETGQILPDEQYAAWKRGETKPEARTAHGSDNPPVVIYVVLIPIMLAIMAGVYVGIGYLISLGWHMAR